MSLLVWLPMTKDLSNQGLETISVTNNGATVDNNGKIGKCYNFNGTYLQFTNPLPSTCSEFSVCGWVRLTSGYAANNGLHLLSFQQTYGRICISKDGLAVRVLLTDGSKNYMGGSTSTSSAVTAGVWNHYAVTFKSGVVKVYINGILDSSATSTVIAPKFTESICRIGTYSSEAAKGCVNDFRLFDHALSPKEIEILSRGLVCHYPLEGTNNTLLPFGYQQLEYIESAGAAAFDTTYKFNPETDSVKITFKGNDTSNNGMLFGQSAGKYFWIYYYGSNGIRVYANNGSGQQSIAGISSDLNKHTAEYKNKHYYIDGTDKGSLSNAYAEQPTTSWICSYGGTSYGFKGRIYYAQICRSGVPQRTFIPAKKLSDSKIGMYDVSNNVFYPSSTSTAFTAGDVVGTPSTVYDCSGYQYNGTISGSLTTSSDTARYSASTYIPKAGYIQHPNALGSDIMKQEWTCCAWVKLDTTTSAQRLNDFNLGNMVVYSTNGKPLLYLNGGTHDYYRYGSVAVPANTWTHIAFVFKNSDATRNVYINGVLTNSSGPNMDSTPAGIPSTVTIFGGNFDGYVSDYREYATALSAAQVAELYNTAVSIANNGTLMGYELVEV